MHLEPLVKWVENRDGLAKFGTKWHDSIGQGLYTHHIGAALGEDLETYI